MIKFLPYILLGVLLHIFLYTMLFVFIKKVLTDFNKYTLTRAVTITTMCVILHICKYIFFKGTI